MSEKGLHHRPCRDRREGRNSMTEEGGDTEVGSHRRVLYMQRSLVNMAHIERKPNSLVAPSLPASDTPSYLRHTESR